MTGRSRYNSDFRRGTVDLKTEEFDLSALTIDRGPARSPRPRRSRVRGLVWVGLAVLGLIAAVGIYAWQTAPISVQVAQVANPTASHAAALLNAGGYVVAQRQADVASKATGRLVALLVGPGDRVKAGQIIARIESSDVAARFAQAQANFAAADAAVAQARAGAEEARLQYDRKRRLLEERLIAGAEFDVVSARHAGAQASVSAAEANRAAAGAAVRSAQVDIDNTVIRAPFTGTVLTKNADVGEIVAPFGSSAGSRAAVVRIADMDSLKVEADVSERNLDQVRVGSPCEITLDAFPQTRYRGVVDTIVPTADRAKATVLTKIRFLDPDERVLPEMSAKVAFLSSPTSEAPRSDRPTVPAAAIVSRGGRSVVFVVRDARAVEVPVEVGASIAGTVEVRGVVAGEPVILSPPPNLRTGQRVSPLPAR
ncbi:MAG: efflux RND transporter periplasmic adaptor subunit [Nitrospiria bacterium]